MRIGLTYDLRSDYLAAGYGEEETAEFDRPETIEGIEQAIQSQKHQTDRIGNARRLVERLAQGDRWDLVFNIAEGLHGVGREAQVPAILDVYEIPYTFSDPLVMALCLHKGLTKQVVRNAGVPTPDFAVVERPDDANHVALPFPLFAKPVAEGTGKGISTASKIEDRAALLATCKSLLDEFHQPVLVETFLPGREFTVGVLGNGPEARAIGGMEVHFTAQQAQEIYSYETKRDYEARVQYTPMSGEIAARMSQIALAAWRALGCRDAGRIDFRLATDGTPHFLEVNPLPGLNPTHSDLPILARMAGIDFDGLIHEITNAARKRLGI
jgi:D-alanine-D-alanine ligase